MFKRRLLSIVLLVIMIFCITPSEESHAHTHSFVLYERHLEDVRTRQCLESTQCTVTEYYYSNRYKCTSCEYGFTVNTVESHHSYNH
jgi:hypothetical protein